MNMKIVVFVLNVITVTGLGQSGGTQSLSDYVAKNPNTLFQAANLLVPSKRRKRFTKGHMLDYALFE